MKMKKSFVYILSNQSRSVLYIGMTNNLNYRIEQHKQGVGSIFTKRYKVVDLLYFEDFLDITQAIGREKQLKNWKRDWKIDLIKNFNPEMKDLYNGL